MAITLDGTLGITTPGLTNTGTEILVNLTTTGNTILGDASTDTVLMTGAPSIGGAGLGMGMGFRNRIINGDMRIDQRNAGASLSLTSVSGFPVDRWNPVIRPTGGGTATGQQVSDAPTGFSNSLKLTVATADTSLASQDYYFLWQKIEGFNSYDFLFGTANASSVTLSFWVKSSVTGQLSAFLQNSAESYICPISYTINAANTWEKKTITFSGATAGTWVGATNGDGLHVGFSLANGTGLQSTSGVWTASNLYGSTGDINWMATSGNTWQITGVQLEKGSTATSFDFRDYGTELGLCQRYYWQLSSSDKGGYTNGLIYQGWADTATSSIGIAQFPVTMRTAPTLSTSGTVADYVFRAPQSQGISPVCNGVPTISTSGTNYVRMGATTSSTFTIGAGHYFSFSGNTTGFVGFSAEL